MFIVSRVRRLITKVDYKEWYAPEPVAQRSVMPKITWIGHASFLVQIGGINILLDPIFGKSSFVFDRLVPPGIAIDKLPQIDAVLLSHNHYDHMDYTSLLQIKKKHSPTFFVPQGDSKWFKLRGIDQVHEMSWWQSQSIDPAKWVRITFLPAHHWSGRSLFDINRSLWGSWMIDYDGYRIYFAGDTAWDGHFEQVNKVFGAVDVALMPVGPCEPYKWMLTSHLSAEQAGQAVVTLNARHCIAMHWGTFGFGLDHFTLPVERIHAWWQGNSELVEGRMLHILKVGQSFSEKISKK